MAARIMKTQAKLLVCRKARMVAYLPNLSTMVRHFRAFSSYDEKHPKGDDPFVVVEEPLTDLPDPRLGLLGPQDHRFPMPGMVGLFPDVSTSRQMAAEVPSDLLTAELPSDRHNSVLRQFAAACYDEDMVETSGDSGSSELECVAQDCAENVKKDFQDLFPGQDFSHGSLTVITLSQRTKNDMTAWSSEVSEEREELLAAFIEASQEICAVLKDAGYWADFIDPSSGRPYLGDYTNSTLYETDDRYRHFGFELEDLGCCKVIRHHLWGTHAYVGSLFTNAPCDHPLLTKMAHVKSS